MDDEFPVPSTQLYSYFQIIHKELNLGHPTSHTNPHPLFLLLISFTPVLSIRPRLGTYGVSRCDSSNLNKLSITPSSIEDSLYSSWLKIFLSRTPSNLLSNPRPLWFSLFVNSVTSSESFTVSNHYSPLLIKFSIKYLS